MAENGFEAPIFRVSLFSRGVFRSKYCPPSDIPCFELETQHLSDENTMSASAKRFYADLDRVKRSQFDHVSEIKRGDSDGEITFKYSDSNLEEPLRIQVLATGIFSTLTSLAKIFLL